MDIANWKISVAQRIHCSLWSSGTVSEISDLYSAQIFGPSYDLRCECGAYEGIDRLGLLCPRCGVVVALDSRAQRDARMGKIELSCPCLHPLLKQQRDNLILIETFPIAPIHYRLDRERRVTTLGRKYETLVMANKAIADVLGPPIAEDYGEKLLAVDSRDLQGALDDLVYGTDGGNSDESLLNLLSNHVRHLNPRTSVAFRACGLVISMTAAI